MSLCSTRSWVLLTAAAVAACGGDPPQSVSISHQEAALTAQQNTERALRAVLDSGS